MIALPEATAAPTLSFDSSTNAFNPTVTLAADSDILHVVDWIVASYAGLTTQTGFVRILLDSDVVFEEDIMANGPTQVAFPGGFHGSKGQALTVFLKGFAGVTSKLNIRTR